MRWTDDLVKQVPLGVDPRASSIASGTFVMPKELLKKCFEEVIVAHTRGDSYHNNWYDALDMEEATERKYLFTPPTKDGDMYITVETYSAEIVPSRCITEKDPEGIYRDADMTAPIVKMSISRAIDNSMY